jgi:NodT family efflux transporter outer membrane factor (OMF) lipoprotein
MRVAAIAAALLAAGCTVGPDYAPPAFPLPAAFRVAPAPPAAPAPDIARWWEGFGDPLLNDLVARAFAANTDLAAAAARLRRARSTIASSRADFRPTLDGRGGVTTERNSERGRNAAPGDPEFAVFDASFDASWELDIFGGQRRALEAARAEFGAATADAYATRVSLAADVVRGYVAVRALQERLDLARATVDAQEEAVRLNKTRFRAGLASELDAAQAEALLADFRAALPPLEAELKAQRNGLAVLLGETPERLAVELATPGRVPSPPPLPALGVPADLLRRRPDLVAAERRIAAASARVGQEVAAYYPRLSLTGSFGYQSRRTNDFLSPDARLWSLGPAIRWRLLDFGRIDAAVEGARGDEAEALASWRGALLRAVEEVDTGVGRVTGRGAEARRRQEAVTAQIRARDIAADRFRRGLSEYLPVLDAERRTNDARDAAIRAREAEAAAAVQLLKALGGGWATDVGLAEIAAR